MDVHFVGDNTGGKFPYSLCVRGNHSGNSLDGIWQGKRREDRAKSESFPVSRDFCDRGTYISTPLYTAAKMSCQSVYKHGVQMRLYATPSNLAGNRETSAQALAISTLSSPFGL